jgi:hypothetical protein
MYNKKAGRMFYRVRLNPKFLKTDISKDEDLSVFDFNEDMKKHCLTRLILDVTELISDKIRYNGLTFRQDAEFAYLANTTEFPERDYYVNVFLYHNDDIAREFGMYETDFTFHAVKSGIFQSYDHNPFSLRHRIFVKINTNSFINHFLNEKGFNDKHNRSHDEEILTNWIMELFKEALYVHEYIEATNGLTPGEIFNLDLDPYDFAFGIGVFPEIDNLLRRHSSMDLFNLKNGVLYDLMEERINEKAKYLFRNSLDIYKLPVWDETLDWIDKETAKFLDKRKYRLLNLFSPDKDD